ncbi:hypothetical protein J4732_10880 [Serratia marcescens]|uniref:Uncharacterized protein n=1 Tax=Serratia marcescens TaxID=615 RepID=A0A939NKY3_SERMA|nr:hypothetical protein [Serratia marcescens]
MGDPGDAVIPRALQTRYTFAPAVEISLNARAHAAATLTAAASCVPQTF